MNTSGWSFITKGFCCAARMVGAAMASQAFACFVRTSQEDHSSSSSSSVAVVAAAAAAAGFFSFGFVCRKENIISWSPFEPNPKKKPTKNKKKKKKNKNFQLQS
jgi:hypothetical protein